MGCSSSKSVMPLSAPMSPVVMPPGTRPVSTRMIVKPPQTSSAHTSADAQPTVPGNPTPKSVTSVSAADASSQSHTTESSIAAAAAGQEPARDGAVARTPQVVTAPPSHPTSRRGSGSSPPQAPVPIYSDRRVEGAYAIGRVVGKGQFGKVYIATKRDDGSQVAVKKIEKAKTRQSFIDMEIEVMSRLRGHKHIVQLYEVYDTPTDLYFVMEFMNGGELFDRLIQQGAYSEGEARNALLAVASALQYMHARGVMHRDLKPENLLLTTTDPTDAVLKLADFGLSTTIGPGERVKTKCGTWAYSAPEQRSGAGYDAKIDIWALGVLLFVILSAYHPFDPQGDASQEAIISAIQRCEYSFDDPVWDSISDEAKDLIQRCLTKDPAKRYSADDVLAHPWFGSSTLSAAPIGADMGEKLDRYRARMAAMMKAGMLVTLASVSMMRSVTGKKLGEGGGFAGALLAAAKSPDAAALVDAAAAAAEAEEGSSPVLAPSPAVSDVTHDGGPEGAPDAAAADSGATSVVTVVAESTSPAPARDAAETAAP